MKFSAKKVAFGLVAGAAAVGIATASPASATDEQDMQFIQLLDSHQINANGSEPLAHQVCANLDAGYTPSQETEMIYRISPLTHDHSMWFVAASLAVYCPWHHGQDYYESQPMTPQAPPPMRTLVPNPPPDPDQPVQGQTV